jgi:sodium pump decarboxylase gamma subunit
MTDVILTTAKISFSNVTADTWAVTISGFAIVFVVLAILILIFSVFGRVMNAINKKSSAKKQDKAASSTKQVGAGNEDVPDEVAAVITAAIAQANGGKNFKIKDIKPDGGESK